MPAAGGTAIRIDEVDVPDLARPAANGRRQIGLFDVHVKQIGEQADVSGRKPIEQAAVHVEPHAEREQSGVDAVRLSCVGGDFQLVPFADGRPSGQPADVLTGFLKDGNALGRPVGVAVDKSGALLVADDVGNTIWRVTPADKSARASR